MSKQTKQTKQIKRKKKITSDTIQLALLAAPAVILTFLFSYMAYFGLILAFKNYRPAKGLWGSEWVGFKNFEFLLTSNDLARILKNTLLMNGLFISLGLIASVSFALLMYEVKKAWQVKAFQTVAILPHFLSWVVVSFMVYCLLEENNGLINQVLVGLGGDAVGWYKHPVYWPFILVIVTLWHGTGMGSIIYYSALIGMDAELLEAAEIDGATKLQRVRYISIPHLIPIMTIKTIMSIGNCFRSDFGLFYNVPKNLGHLYPTTDVIDTYVYRAMMDLHNYGMSAAASFFQSVVCCIVLLLTNKIVSKISPENTLF